MFIAHLPAGYLATTPLLDRLRLTSSDYRRLLAVGLVVSVLPDIDLLYFYLVDARSQVHHAYLPHLPLAWLPVFCVTAVVLALTRASKTTWLTLGIVVMNVYLHLALDSTAGGIRWLWPFSESEFALTVVEPRYRPWYLNFLLHWTFALEIALMFAASVILLRRRLIRRRFNEGSAMRRLTDG